MKKKIIISTLFLTLMGSSHAISWADITQNMSTYWDYLTDSTWKKISLGTALLLAYLIKAYSTGKISRMKSDFSKILVEQIFLIAEEYGVDPEATNDTSGNLVVTVKNTLGERTILAKINLQEFIISLGTHFDQNKISTPEQAKATMNSFIREEIAKYKTQK